MGGEGEEGFGLGLGCVMLWFGAVRCGVWAVLGWAVLGWVGLGWVVWCGAVRCGGLGLVANNTKSKCLRLWRPRAYVDDHDVFSVEPPTDASEPFQNLSTWQLLNEQVRGPPSILAERVLVPSGPSE